MQLLAIETSGTLCSAALLIDGVILQRLEYAPRRHGELILSMMHSLLAEAELSVRELDALAFGCGPGSFTGVRIATAVVQGVAFAAEVPVVAVSTLRALAQGQFRRGGQRLVLTALDARMDEVYWGCFMIDDKHLASALAPERVCAPTQVTCPPASTWFGVGSGWAAYGTTLAATVGTAMAGVAAHDDCAAEDVATLAAADLASGGAVAAAVAAPVYLRNQVVRSVMR